MRLAADLCTCLRMALAPVFAWAFLAHDRGSFLPLVVFAVALLTDVADGRLARAATAADDAGPRDARGRLLDHGADALFLFPALGVLAHLGRVPILLPLAAGTAFALYVLRGWRRRGEIPTLVPTQAGHVAGTLNYLLAGSAALLHAAPLPGRLDAALFAAALAGAAVNVVAAVEHVRAHRGVRPGLFAP